MTQHNYILLITRIFSAFSFVFVCAFLFDPGPDFCFCLSSHRSQLVTATLLLVLCPVQPPTQIRPRGFRMQILTSYAQCCGRCSICHRLRLCRRPCVRRAWPQATWTCGGCGVVTLSPSTNASIPCGCLNGHAHKHAHTHAHTRARAHTHTHTHTHTSEYVDTRPGLPMPRP